MNNPIQRLRRYRWILLTRKKYKSKIKYLAKEDAINLNIGSGKLNYEGWINLNLPFFDLRNKNLWSYILGRNQFSRILLEHVLEHLTASEVKTSLINAKNHMGKHSVIRIAVPDRFHPSKEYIEFVRPNGSGPGCDDHFSFWSYTDFQELGKSLNLSIDFLEYHDENGEFHAKKWDTSDGYIKRCYANKNQNKIENYTSLIIDVRI